MLKKIFYWTIRYGQGSDTHKKNNNGSMLHITCNRFKILIFLWRPSNPSFLINYIFQSIQTLGQWQIWQAIQ